MWAFRRDPESLSAEEKQALEALFEKIPALGTDQEFSSSNEHLGSNTTRVFFIVSFPRDRLKTVSFFVSLLENALRFPISLVVSIVRSAPVGKGASVFAWLK